VDLKEMRIVDWIHVAHDKVNRLVIVIRVNIP
jgi:hypothetical protein